MISWLPITAGTAESVPPASAPVAVASRSARVLPCAGWSTTTVGSVGVIRCGGTGSLVCGASAVTRAATSSSGPAAAAGAPGGSSTPGVWHVTVISGTGAPAACSGSCVAVTSGPGPSAGQGGAGSAPLMVASTAGTARALIAASAPSVTTSGWLHWAHFIL